MTNGLTGFANSARVAGSAEVVRAVDVEKRFGQLEAVKGLSLSVARGEVVCVIGPSGSGKTTFLRCINWLERPDAGAIWIDGEQIGYRTAPGKKSRLASKGELAMQRRKIGFVFQQFNLFPHLTALENVVEAPIRVLRRPRDEALSEGKALLARVGLASKERAFPGRLSGGQQQRVAIARALAMRPVVMLFDEPTSALDPETVGDVVDVMEELAQEMTMIVVTHEMGFAKRAANRIVMIDHGETVEEAPPEEFFADPRHPRSRAFLSKMLH